MKNWHRKLQFLCDDNEILYIWLYHIFWLSRLFAAVFVFSSFVWRFSGLWGILWGFFEELVWLLNLKGFLLAVRKEFQSSDWYQYMVLISTLSSFSQLLRPSIGFVLLFVTSRISGTVKSPGKEWYRLFAGKYERELIWIHQIWKRIWELFSIIVYISCLFGC